MLVYNAQMTTSAQAVGHSARTNQTGYRYHIVTDPKILASTIFSLVFVKTLPPSLPPSCVSWKELMLEQLLTCVHLYCYHPEECTTSR